MKKTTLQSVHDALAKKQYVIEVDPEVSAAARSSLTRMLEVKG